MKTRIIFFFLVTTAISRLSAQGSMVQSLVYNWNDLKIEKKETNDRRAILDGKTADLDLLEIHATTLQPGKAPHPPHKHDDSEELVIITEGQLKVTINNVTKILGPGSIAFAIPGEEHGFENEADTKATYYVLKFKSKKPINVERAKKAGGSFMVDWNDVAVTSTERGSRRNIFDRATSMFERFEMHVTTLNKGLVSHAPHSHRAEEIILLIKGSAEMQIGEAQNKADLGALVFLETNVLHALKNTADGQVQYFAFQFQP